MSPSQTKPAVLLLVLVGLSFSLASLSVNPVWAVSRGWHNPIVISNDSGFTAANGISGGTGSASRPYIIDGWDIDGSLSSVACPAYGVYAAIAICNTNVHFIIRDVNVHSGYSSGYTSGYGIVLSNVTHGNVESSTVNDNYWGIFVRYSGNMSLIGNTVTNNIQGILIYGSSNVAVSSNGGGDDLWLSQSSSVSIIQNIVRTIFVDGKNVTLHGNYVKVDLAVYSFSREGYSSYIITRDNLVNGEPFYYYKDCTHLSVHGLVVGRLLVANCSDVIVTGVDAKAIGGLGFVFVEHGRFSNNNATIFYLSRSSGLSIMNNIIIRGGIFCYGSTDVMIANNEGLDSTIYCNGSTIRHNSGLEIAPPSGP